MKFRDTLWELIKKKKAFTFEGLTKHGLKYTYVHEGKYVGMWSYSKQRKTQTYRLVKFECSNEYISKVARATKEKKFFSIGAPEYLLNLAFGERPNYKDKKCRMFVSAWSKFCKANNIPTIADKYPDFFSSKISYCPTKIKFSEVYGIESKEGLLAEDIYNSKTGYSHKLSIRSKIANSFLNNSLFGAVCEQFNFKESKYKEAKKILKRFTDGTSGSYTTVIDLHNLSTIRNDGLWMSELKYNFLTTKYEKNNEAGLKIIKLGEV